MKESSRTNGGFRALLTISWRNIWRNRRRTILCVVAVGAAVFFNVFMQSWVDGMFDGIEEIVTTFDTGHVNAVSNQFDADREYLPVQFPLADGRNGAELAGEAEALPGVIAALPRITAYASLFDSLVKHAFLWGIDIEAETAIHDFNLTDRTDGLVEGRFPAKGKNECAIGTALAKKAGLRIGDSIPLKTVSAQFSDKYWNPVITGIFEFDYVTYDEKTIIVPFDRLQRVLGLGEGIQQLVVYAKNPARTAHIRQGLAEILGEGNMVREWTENYWIALFKSMSGLYIVIFGVFQIVASFLIINTMLMVIHERIKEIGMMGALGMTRREIVSVFFLEAVLLSVLGSLFGCLVAGLATWGGSLFPIDMYAFTGGGMKDLPISGTLFMVFSVRNLVEGFFFGVFVSSACTLFPSMKSAFIEPVEALRR